MSKTEKFSMRSGADGLKISVMTVTPENGADIKGVVQLSHGMSEHKGRYLPFMKFLSGSGYACIMNDHRGHGESVKCREDLGNTYTDDPEVISEDLYLVTRYAEQRWQGKPVYMFSHSMGTMAARVYIQKHDDSLNGLVMCGPPTENDMLFFGFASVGASRLMHGDAYRSGIVNSLAGSVFEIKGESPKSWLSTDKSVPESYLDDELCGFEYTNSGYGMIFRLLDRSYIRSAYEVKNPDLPILMMAGSDDPVIQSPARYRKLVSFLKKIGYTDVAARLYKNKRHELLNEIGKERIWQDILNWFETRRLN